MNSITGQFGALVVAAIVIKSDKVLIARRGPNEKLAGSWEFPGGKVESGETPQQSLERELREEFGVTAVAGRIIVESEYVYDHGAFRLLALETELNDEGLSLTVHDRVEWVDMNELGGYKLLPADIPIAEHLRKVRR
ncbi:MAG: (deoxy)nucleoside triphosphate pyrophosphohydrolase [Acidobacteriota bacterium]|nr:MAG: (deoxy)nucleoside triphosphate pyrophosphohydrolase [Acidobacteriota bacterium]